LLNEQPEDYYTLKSYLFDHLKDFDLTTLRQFLGFMANYCTWQIGDGNKTFLQEKHEVYEQGLILKCWSSGIYFSEHQFVRIVKSALSLNKTNWAGDFIKNYHKQMNPDAEVNITHYCLALLAFQRQQFDLAQENLIKISATEDFIYHLDFKILLVKIYHESQSLNIKNIDKHPINHELEAIRQYVLSGNNRKMSETIRQMFNNFVNVYKRILERRKKLVTKQQVSLSSIQKLKRDLAATSPLTEREWLEEKVRELSSLLG